MSFFKDIAAEIKNELEKASSELGVDINALSQGKATPQPVNRPASTSAANQGTAGNAQKRRRKKRQPNEAGAASEVVEPTSTTTVERANAEATTTTVQNKAVKPHKLVANLTPAAARNAIVLSEVLGPPVSKRKRKA